MSFYVLQTVSKEIIFIQKRYTVIHRTHQPFELPIFLKTYWVCTTIMVVHLYGSSLMIKYGRKCHLPTLKTKEEREISHVTKVIN